MTDPYDKKEFVRCLNTAQLGSLGERIVYYFYNKELKKLVSNYHRDCVDIIVDGKPVDVKTRRQLTKECAKPEKPIRYSGKRRRRDIGYDHLIFYKNLILLTYHAGELDPLKVSTKKWSWEQLAWDELNITPIDSDITKSPNDRSSVRRQQMKDLSNWFNGRLFCFYRGPADWQNQPPDNSWPTKSRLNKYFGQVFVQYALPGDGKEIIQYIVAFPFTELPRLPLGRVTQRVKRKGIIFVLDLKRVRQGQEYRKYVFDSFDDLKKQFPERFPGWDQNCS